jgi:hypothetical protein
MKQNNNEVQYIWHDGATIPENLLISMAKNAGSYESAKGYLFSLMAHGLNNGIGDYIYKVNEIRDFYHVMPIPIAKEMAQNATCNQSSPTDLARKRYKAMNLDCRKQVVTNSLNLLLSHCRNLFNSKNDWIGIYLVIKDRVNGRISKTRFTKLMMDLTRDWWPQELQIGERTLSNFGRCVAYEDRLEAYYDMEQNPWSELCDTYWNILMQQILTQN